MAKQDGEREADGVGVVRGGRTGGVVRGGNYEEADFEHAPGCLTPGDWCMSRGCGGGCIVQGQADASRNGTYATVADVEAALTPPEDPIAAELRKQGAQIASLQIAVSRLERATHPIRFHPSLADLIRDGWSNGLRLKGLTTPRDGSEPSPVWGTAKHASNELRKAALDFDACQERLIEIVSACEDGQPRNDDEHRKALKDMIVSLGDCAASCQVAAREVDG